MKKGISVLVAVAMLFTTVISTAAADSTTDVRIDFRMNTAKQDYAANYFSWTVGKQAPVKDSFDAVSGASLKGSTRIFNTVRYAEPAADKKAALPSALRSLFLFPLVDWKFVAEYGLQITDNKGSLTIRFARKTTAYELTTDKNGNFNLLTGAKIAKDITEKTDSGYAIKKEYLKAGGNPLKMADLDWSKLPLTKDAFSPEAAYHYEGNLKCTFKNNILTVNGILNRKQKNKQQPVAFRKDIAIKNSAELLSLSCITMLKEVKVIAENCVQP